MANCTEFPVRQDQNVLFYISNIVLIPVLFGVGFMGNLMTTVLCNHSSLRKENAVFIHICGLAVVDLISLLCTVPETLQKIEIFPVEVTFSRFLAYADMFAYVFGNISHHAALWLMVSAGLIKLHIAKFPYESSRASRNSTNRIIVFGSVFVCTLLNFPRFLEVSVSEVLGHCFHGLSLWDFHLTSFGHQRFVKVIYPWIVIALGQSLPLFLILIAMMALGRRAGWERLRKTKLAMSSSHNDEKRRLGLLKAIWVLLLVGFCFEVPNLVVQIFQQCFPPEIFDEKTSKISMAIARYLGLVRTSITFVIYIVYCSDFRRAMRRTFCCLCACADEFYEPCACCNPTYRRELKRTKEEEAKKLKRRAKKKKKNEEQKTREKERELSRDETDAGIYDVYRYTDRIPTQAAIPKPNHSGPPPLPYDPYLPVPGSTFSLRENNVAGSIHTQLSERGSALSVQDTAMNGAVTNVVVDPSGNPWV